MKLSKIGFLLGIIIIFSCKNEPNVNPIYWNYENDLQENNLYAKVKEVEIYTVSKSGKLILNSKMEFSKFGNIKTSEIYNESGKSIKSIINKYNQNNKLIQSQTESENLKLFEKIKYDTLKKISHKFIKVNDTMNIEVITNYNKKGKIITEIEINKTDTIFRNYKYEYNENEKITLEKEIEIENGYKKEQFRKYKFDKFVNIIEFHNKNQFFNLVNEITYSINNRVTEIKQYYITQDEKKQLDEVFKFDLYFNKKTESKYKDGKIVQEKRNEYKIDEHGNWNTKKSFIKDKMVEKIIRKIKYW